MNDFHTPSPLKVLSNEEYVRQRLQPSPLGTHYLHLKDLASLIRRIAPGVRGDVLDFGSGGAPYAACFSGCSSYTAADIEPGPAVQLVLRPDGSTGAPEANWDFVLSTQVLEHVRHPRAYVAECFRVLRPGGELLLTTHGMYEEHGCPDDYQRWTARGIEELMLESGFHVLETGKLTADVRGVIQLMNQFSHHLRHPNRRFWHSLLSLYRVLHVAILTPLLNRFADLFPEQAVVRGNSSARIYVAVYAWVRKPFPAGPGNGIAGT